MLQSRPPIAENGEFHGQHPQDLRRHEIPFRLGALKRHKFLIAFSCLALTALGLLYVMSRQTHYEAVSQLLIDHQVLQLGQQDVIFSTSSVDAARVQNQLAILRSRVISLRVVDNLGLADHPQFQNPGAGMRDRLIGGLSAPVRALADATGGEASIFHPIAEAVSPPPQEPLPLELRRLAAGDYVRANLTVRSIGASHTIEVRYVAGDPTEAAMIANEIVSVYLEDQSEANARAARSASGWIQERISGLGTNARVITEATPPSQPTGASTTAILTAAAMAGLLLGAGGAWLRDAFDSRLRSPQEARALVGAEFLGHIPVSRERERLVTLSETPPGSPAKTILSYSSRFDWALDHPLSLCAHTLEKVLLAAGRVHPNKTLGIVSTLAGEGRTTIAANLARLAAANGKRVLLVDAVPYKPDLSQKFLRTGEKGLVEILQDGLSLEETIWTDSRTGLHVLPFGGAGRPLSRRRNLWSQKMETFVRKAQNAYDLVVFDLPPLSLVPDVRAAAGILDSLLLVIGWNEAPSELLHEELAAAGIPRGNVIGFVFNKVKAAEAGPAGWRAHRRHLRPYMDDAFPDLPSAAPAARKTS